MKKLKTIFGILFLSVVFFSQLLKADENVQKALDPHEFNFFVGKFDYNRKNNTSLFGIQHENQNLFRNTFIGKISPITGFMMTGDNSTYLYTGVEANYNIGYINFTPSFSPGLYGQGHGKDLGHMLEFKSELQLSLDLPKDTEFGFSLNHMSNGDISEKNPGTDNYMFNFLKKF